jgi:hypothetical protein
MGVDPVDHSAGDGRSPASIERSSGSLERLRELLLDEGDLMRTLVVESIEEVSGAARPPTVSSGAPRGGASPAPEGPAQLAAAGPRVGDRALDYELLIEAIYEGYLLHYHSPRVLRPAENDLGLLAGDRLYALGLARLVKLGDIEAVAELADVITLSALAQAGGHLDLADAVWMAGARAVGWGGSSLHERAKAMVRAGSPGALEAMRGLSA